jgi:hypothetical protein
MKQDIPVRLLAEKSALLVPDNHRVSFYASTWLNRFANDRDLNELIQKYPQQISRAEIADLANQVLAGSENVRKVFLATMIWGYGTVGYGAYRTSMMLSDTDSQRIIEESFRLVSIGKYIDAYKMFALPKCGAAFFTKYFYFVGLGTNVSPLPLILDSVVANSLVQLGIDIARLARFTKNTSGRITSIGKYADGYSQYVEMMNHWANEIGCRPDSIEKWLFTLQI